MTSKYDAANQKLANPVSEGKDLGKDVANQSENKANAMNSDVRNSLNS